MTTHSPSEQAVNPPAAPTGLLDRSVAATVQLSLAAVRLPLRLARPIILSSPLRPLRDAGDAALRRMVDAFASVIAEELQHNYEVQSLIEVITERVLRDLGTRASTTALVRAQVESTVAALAAEPAATHALVASAAQGLLANLAQNPTALRPLVRAVVSDTVSHLTTQPQDVNALAAVVAADVIMALRERPLLADGLVRTLADRYIATLSAEPEHLDALVQGVSERLLEHLQSDPAALDALVQVAGDRYLEHLHTNPANVQDLLTTQSVTMATEVVGEVRSGSTVADNAVENIVRSLLGKKPRTEFSPHTSASAGV